MDGLRTARVLILENDPSAALPLIQALALDGIGAVYVSGTDQDVLDALAARPLQGIRLIFADVDLLEVGGSVETIVGHTTGVLRAILASDSQPLVIVTWTRSSELGDAFAE